MMPEVPLPPPPPVQLELDEAKALFRLLWLSYLGQWGPRFRSRGRRHHHWRLHGLLNFMYEVEGIREDTPEWDAFLDQLPGFASYWSREGAYAAHHAE